MHLQIGAIFVWSYAFVIVSAYAPKSTEKNSAQSSEGVSETSSESWREALLPTSYSQISEDSSGKVELPLTHSNEGTKVCPVQYFPSII